MTSDVDGVGPSVPGLPRLSRGSAREWTPNGSGKTAEREHG